jgi:hypothetical protein
MKSEVRYPSIRAELIDYLLELSDADYQRRNWVLGSLSEGESRSCLDYAVHFIFDDTSLGEDAAGCIGTVLANEAEAERITDVARCLASVFQRYGAALPDERYIETDEWVSVVGSAKSALHELLKTDRAE